MMVTAYLVSIAIASIVRSFYYINFLTIKFSMTGASKKNNITDFLTMQNLGWDWVYCDTSYPWY